MNTSHKPDSRSARVEKADKRNVEQFEHLPQFESMAVRRRGSRGCISAMGNRRDHQGDLAMASRDRHGRRHRLRARDRRALVEAAQELVIDETSGKALSKKHLHTKGGRDGYEQ